MEDVKEYINKHVILNKYLKLENDVSLNSKTNIIIDFYNVYCNYIKFNKYNTFTNESFRMLLKHICEYFVTCKNVVIVSKEIYESEGNDFISETLSGYPNVSYYIIKDKDKKNPGKNRERDDFYLLYKFFLYSNDSKDTFIFSNDKFKNYNNIVNNIKPLEVIKINNEQNYTINIDLFDLNNIKRILLSKNKNLINKINCNFIVN